MPVLINTLTTFSIIFMLFYEFLEEWVIWSWYIIYMIFLKGNCDLCEIFRKTKTWCKVLLVGKSEKQEVFILDCFKIFWSLLIIWTCFRPQIPDLTKFRKKNQVLNIQILIQECRQFPIKLSQHFIKRMIA